MALTDAGFQDYDFNRMVVRFTMMDDQTAVPCAISTDAMDHLEGTSRTKPDQREEQFLRLRDRIGDARRANSLPSSWKATRPALSCALSIFATELRSWAVRLR